MKYIIRIPLYSLFILILPLIIRLARSVLSGAGALYVIFVSGSVVICCCGSSCASFPAFSGSFGVSFVSASFGCSVVCSCGFSGSFTVLTSFAVNDPVSLYVSYNTCCAASSNPAISFAAFVLIFPAANSALNGSINLLSMCSNVPIFVLFVPKKSAITFCIFPGILLSFCHSSKSCRTSFISCIFS